MNREELRRINKLTSDRLNELKERYYNTDEKTADLIKEFGLIGVQPSQLYLLFDDVITEVKCPYCNSFMTCEPFSRSTSWGRDLKCPTCEHKAYKDEYELCYCDKCNQQREHELRKFFQTEHSVDYGSLAELNFIERLFLGTLNFYGRREIGGDILSMEKQKDNFTFWDKDEAEEKFYGLYNKKCLVVSSRSTLNDFRFNNSNKFDIYDDFINPPYELWLHPEDIEKLNLGDLCGREGIVSQWKEINRKEAKFYLIKILKSCHLRHYTNEQINDIIDDYIKEFSLSETLSAIKYVTTSHIHDLRMNKTDKSEIIKQVFFHLKTYYKWAILNRGKIRDYAKKFPIENITCLSQYFYMKVLKDEASFKVCPKNFVNDESLTVEKPYIILHMLVSIDGKITGDYMSTETAGALCEEYYRINREYRADAFVCGRITMEGSFTQGVKPDLMQYKGLKMSHEDYVAKQHKYYAVSIDPHGRLGWYGSEIKDEDPGYDNAHIIEVLTDDIQDEYLFFLKQKGISYIFCGKEKIDIQVMNEKLYLLFGIKKLMLEGGGLTDSLFLEADYIDEMSLVIVPLVDGSKDGVNLFEEKSCNIQEYELKTVEKLPQNGLWLNYKRKSN